MNLQVLRQKLSKIERQRQDLEKQIQARAGKQLTALPAQVGLKSVDELILALGPYASSRLRARIVNGSDGVPAARPGVGRRNGAAKKSTGTRYTEAVKLAIKKALEKGDMTAAEISSKFGASVVSINKWKKQYNLVKPRKKKSSKATPAAAAAAE